MNQKDLEKEVADAKDALMFAVVEVNDANFSLKSAWNRLKEEEDNLNKFYLEQKASADVPN